MASAKSCSGGARDAQVQLPHVVMFPFMAKSHATPLTHLAHLLRRRQLATVTFFTTPGNAAFLRAALSGADGVAVLELPFPDDVVIPGVPPGAECFEALDSLSSLPAFTAAVSLLRPRFEEELAAMRPPASVVVADAFLYWAHAAAAAVGVRTLAFFGGNMFLHVMMEVIVRDNPVAMLAGGASDAAFTVPEFPHVQLSLDDLPFPFNEPDLMAAPSMRKMGAKLLKAIADSHGLIVNTFQAMESRYIDHWNRHVGPRAWPVGPLCLAQPTTPPLDVAPAWMRWLDEKAVAGRAVLYVMLGTTVAVPGAQLREVADGLEHSGLDFLWAVRPVDADLGGVEERVRGRGMVVREWVDQRAILRHDGVKGFMSHCGWNSVIESVSAGVPLAVWPMSAEQPLNAKLVDELKIGIRVVPSKHGMTSTLVRVRSEEVASVAKELMKGEKGAEAARNMAALAAKAREAVDEGGSSWRAVEEMIAGLGQPA